MEPIDLPALLRRIEQEYIEAALRSAGGNKQAAADLLGLRRTTLVEKLKRQRAQSCGTGIAGAAAAAALPGLAPSAP